MYTAFIIDVFARRIVGWKVAKHMDTDLVMDALDRPFQLDPLAQTIGC